MNNNRNNRRRGRGNRPQGGGSPVNRIDSRARGNAPQLLDKYKKLAQDAQHNGDRVQAEYYLQFADHYYRVIADGRTRQDEMRARRPERDDYRDRTSEDEGERFEADERRAYAERGDEGRGDEGRAASDRYPDFSSDSEGEYGDDDGEAPRRERQSQREPRGQERSAERGQPRGQERGQDRQQGEPRRRRDSRARPTGGEIDVAVLPPAFAPAGDLQSEPKPLAALEEGAQGDDAGEARTEARAAPAPRRRRKPANAGGEEPLSAVVSAVG